MFYVFVIYKTWNVIKAFLHDLLLSGLVFALFRILRL